MDHLPLGRSYLVVVLSYDLSCALILSTGLFGLDLWAILISILHRLVQYLGVDRNDPLGSEIDHLAPLGRSYLAEGSLYDMSCTLITFTGLYG